MHLLHRVAVTVHEATDIGCAWIGGHSKHCCGIDSLEASIDSWLLTIYKDCKTNQLTACAMGLLSAAMFMQSSCFCTYLLQAVGLPEILPHVDTRSSFC